MPVMRFSNTRQIVIMTISWAAALYAIDFWKHPRPLRDLMQSGGNRAEFAHITKPQIVLWMNHMCCSGCLEDLELALKGLGWIGKVSVNLDKNESGALPDKDGASGLKSGQYGHRVDLEVTNVATIDFVALERAVRDMGLAPERIEFGGVSHYRIEAKLKHVCCQACARAIDEGMQMASNLRAAGPFKWLDSAKVSKEHKSITVYPKYDSTVDVTEFLQALTHMGFAPEALRVQPGDET